MKTGKEVVYQGLVLGSCMSLVSKFHVEPRNYWTLSSNVILLWTLLFGKEVPMIRIIRIFVISSCSKTKRCKHVIFVVCYCCIMQLSSHS